MFCDIQAVKEVFAWRKEVVFMPVLNQQNFHLLEASDRLASTVQCVQSVIRMPHRPVCK